MLQKSQVSYEHPAKGPDHCSDCVHFAVRGPQTCAIVAGHIEGGDWCERFRRKPLPAVSKAQQEAMAIAEHSLGKLYAKNKGLLKMTGSQLHDFAATPRKNLPAYAGKKKKGKFSI